MNSNVISFAVSATPGSTLTKRPREEELDSITLELESQDEPTEPPNSKKLRMQRMELEVSLSQLKRKRMRNRIYTPELMISAGHRSAFSD